MSEINHGIAIAIEVAVVGKTWEGLEGAYHKAIALPERPSRIEIEELRGGLLDGSARAKLGQELVEFGDFQYLTDCRIEFATCEIAYKGAKRQTIREHEILCEFLDGGEKYAAITGDVVED